jgi:hypothetical protein
VAVVLVALGPTVRALALHTGWWAVVVGGLGAAIGLAIATAPRLRPPDVVRAVGAGVGLLAVTLVAGPVAGLWTAFGVVAAVGAVTFLAREGSAGTVRGLGPVIGTTVGAAVVGLLHPTSVVVLAAGLIPALLGVAAAARPARLLAIDDGAKRGVEWFGDALRAICFAVLAVPFVVLPWLVGRIVRWDTTWFPRERGSRWVAARADDVPSDRPWQPAPPRATWPWTRRATRLALRLVLVVVLLTVAVDVIRERASAPNSYLLEAPAMADSAFWPELTQAQEQLRANMGLGSYAYEQPDVASAHLNIVDGHRTTWAPPAPASCTPPKVWMFGGSTMFGEGQRDEHTIPSWLARTAWEDDVALDVTNFGQLGDPLWIEVRRLEEALGTTDERPDLVVFYDGANEVITRIVLNGEGRAAQRTFVSYLDSGLFIQLDRFLRPVYRFMTESDALRIEDPPEADLDADEVAALAARQYRLALTSSRRLVADEGLDTVWFNQPTTWSTPMPDEEVAYQGDADRFGRQVTEAYERELPEGVVDLSTMFADTEEPVFYDTAHTNELGARRVAEAMWDELQPRLSERCEEVGSCC